MRVIDEISIHCSATRPSWMAHNSLPDKLAEIRRWHVDENGWSDVGYHFVMDRDGSIIVARPLDRTGALIRGFNKRKVGICLIGGHGGSERDDFLDNFTAAQEASLRDFIQDMKGKLGPLKVSGHNQYANKACPCFHVPTWYDSTPAKRVPVMGGYKAHAPRESVLQTTSVRSGAGGITTGIVTAVTSLLADLDPTVQLGLIILAGAMIVFSGVNILERVKHWWAGVR
jgi:hypothetical protein